MSSLFSKYAFIFFYSALGWGEEKGGWGKRNGGRREETEVGGGGREGGRGERKPCRSNVRFLLKHVYYAKGALHPSICKC